MARRMDAHRSDLLKMDQLTSRLGARLLLVGRSAGIQVHPDAGARAAMATKLGVPDLSYPDTRLAEFARTHGIRAIMPASAMRQFAEANRAFLHGFRNSAFR